MGSYGFDIYAYVIVSKPSGIALHNLTPYRWVYCENCPRNRVYLRPHQFLPSSHLELLFLGTCSSWLRFADDPGFSATCIVSTEVYHFCHSRVVTDISLFKSEIPTFDFVTIR